MAGLSLRCGDCGALLKSVEEAQEHAELTKHSNFSESTEAVLNLVCATCGKPCRTRTYGRYIPVGWRIVVSTCTAQYRRYIPVRQLTGTWIARYWVVPSVGVVSAPLSLTGRFRHQRPISSSISRGREKEEEVEEKLGVVLLFPCAIRCLCNPSPASKEIARGRFLLPMRGEEMSPRVGKRNEATTIDKSGKFNSNLDIGGNSSIEAAINWVAEHEDDPDIDQMPLVW
ncbi:hypothetical protein GW17_00000058 [Ensete ventricosum]|nr:hypothetical protein GW17_00000058 [Ensete ventricosum]